MENDKLDIRFVKVRDIVYLRKEDILEYLRELGATEETDVRERIETAAQNISQIK